jgi:AmmeMemoRadiSam system protein A
MSTDFIQAAAEYSAQERALLLGIARQAIANVLNSSLPAPKAVTGHLSEPRGAFTTLHLHGGLRGCIGFVEPLYPLWQTIVETARSAAFEDPRFFPLTGEEFRNIQLEISVMSLMLPITPEEVVVGRHGLMISQGSRRGLLLPQVAPEWGWDPEEFLSQTCIKASLPRDAWKHGAKIEAFTAEVFSE